MAKPLKDAWINAEDQLYDGISAIAQQQAAANAKGAKHVEECKKPDCTCNEDEAGEPFKLQK